MISISLSSECIRNPRCSFCYIEHECKFDVRAIRNSILNAKSNLLDLGVYGFEYSGYNLISISRILEGINTTNVSITTTPDLIDDNILGSNVIDNVALSYNSEVDIDKWIAAARSILSSGKYLSCNYLVQNIPMNVPRGIIKYSNQLNILTLKPTGVIDDHVLPMLWLELAIVSKHIELCIDNCLAMQMELANECHMGTEFIHILPDGRVIDCSFGGKCNYYVESG